MLKLQYFCHLMWRADSLEKTLMLGKTEGRRRRGNRGWEWYDSITDSMDMNLRKLQEIPKVRGGWRATVLGVTKSQTSLGDWTTIDASTHIKRHLTYIKFKEKKQLAKHMIKREKKRRLSFLSQEDGKGEWMVTEWGSGVRVMLGTRPAWGVHWGWEPVENLDKLLLGLLLDQP